MVLLTTSGETKTFVMKLCIIFNIEFNSQTISLVFHEFVNKWLQKQKFVMKVHGFVNKAC